VTHSEAALLEVALRIATSRMIGWWVWSVFISRKVAKTQRKELNYIRSKRCNPRKRNEPQMDVDFKNLLKNSIFTLRVKLIIDATLWLSALICVHLRFYFPL
jgi:hypothetical protein